MEHDVDADLYADDAYADEHGADDHWGEHEDDTAPEPSLRVLVYSDDRVTRRQVMSALGRRPALDLPVLEYDEVATEPMVIRKVDASRYDLLILDGEATPAGGMGICRQLKDEIYHCPPIVVLVGRPQDAWLATWSRADGVSSHPIDAIALADVVARVMRPRLAVATS